MNVTLLNAFRHCLSNTTIEWPDSIPYCSLELLTSKQSNPLSITVLFILIIVIYFFYKSFPQIKTLWNIKKSLNKKPSTSLLDKFNSLENGTKEETRKEEEGGTKTKSE